MDAGRSRAKAPGKHEWNSYENYCIAHESVLDTHRHPFINSHSVQIGLYAFFDSLLVVVWGEIECPNGIILTVEKYAETRVVGSGRRQRLQARTFSFRYNAHKKGHHPLLRYDNSHADDEYHAHYYDDATGIETENRPLTREEM